MMTIKTASFPLKSVAIIGRRVVIWIVVFNKVMVGGIDIEILTTTAALKNGNVKQTEG